uniref:Uncharacterized protein n=1 Tax=Panagrolaimus davidi TaxID=227884 RepID=A0A914PJK6_9BILA
MKLSLSFLVFVALIQLGSSNILSKRGTQEQLLSDANAVQNGSDVIMVKPGPLEVVLNNANELAFEVCEQNCFAPFLVCFEGAFNGSFSTAFCDSKCGFYVDSNENGTTFMNPFTQVNKGRPKRNCTEMLMKNGRTKQQDSNTVYLSCAPKVENGIVKLNIMNATSDCVVSIKNAYIKVETTTAPPKTITTIGQLDQTSSGKNAATTDEPGNFFGDYWWIILIAVLMLVAIGVGVGVYCYLRCKKKAQKPVPIRRRRLHGSKSPVVLQPSTETQQRKTESAVLPNSLYNQSSILSHKSLLNSKKDEAKKEPPESTDLTSMKPAA